MPYIKQAERKVIDRLPIDRIFESVEAEPGNLNYALTRLCHEYLRRGGKRYKTMNDIVGALEGCKMEFYRRTVAPYEDAKIEENGDVSSNQAPHAS